MQIRVKVQLLNKTPIQSKSNSKSSNNKSALANNDSDYDEDQFEEVNYSNGLHDYKINNNEYIQSNANDQLRKPSFLNKQSKANAAYNNYGNNQISESKLPPSLRWVLEEDNQEVGSAESFERNSKANAHLAPIHNSGASNKPQLYKNGNSNITASVGTIYGGTDQQTIDRIPSIKKLSSQKTRRLQPLRK